MKTGFITVVVTLLGVIAMSAPAIAGNIYCDSAGMLRCDNGAYYGISCSQHSADNCANCDDKNPSTIDECKQIPYSPPAPRGQGCVPGNACPMSCYHTSVDLQNDPVNCGSIGNVCASGTCTNGACNDFTVSVDPTSGFGNAGDTKSVNATLTKVAGNVAATFSVTGLPSGASASFSPASCTPSCYSNATITTTGSTPTGSAVVTIKATSGSIVRSASYNLTVLPSSSGLSSCGDSVCQYPETQSSCSTDCKTVTNITSPVAPGENVAVSVEFRDFRYRSGDKVRIDLVMNPDGISWNSENGCSFAGQKMGPTAGTGNIAWPAGTISESGHFKISTTCNVPNTVGAGFKTLVATPTIY